MRRLISLFTTEHGANTVELAATTSIAIGLAWLLVLGGHHALKASRETQCLSNLRQIHQAVMLYRVEHSSFPVLEEGGSLQTKMAPWLSSGKVFHCPEDKKTSSESDSYSYFYAPRALGSETDGYMIGCPRHLNYSHGVTVMSSGVAETAKMSKISHNGVEIHPGQSFNYGEFKFEDGSVASIGMGGQSIAQEKNDNGKDNGNGTVNELPSVTPVISYRDGDGKYHTILKIDEGSMGTARFSIVPGNRFEVVTPSAIIAVRGTEFSVQTLKQGGKHATRVEVYSGEVEMQPVGKGSGVRVKGGEKAFGLKGESPYLE